MKLYPERRAFFLAAAAVLALVAGSMPAAGRAADAETNYKKHCRPCHGDGGRGDGPAAKVLKPPPGDFTDCERMSGHDQKWLVEIIGNGGPAVGRSKQMVGLGKKLSPEEIEALSGYVRAFCTND